jgi:hypothetical protein
VIDHADERAAFFFLSNLSSVGSSAYDRWIVSSQNCRDGFTEADIRVMNTTMTARTAYQHWTTLTGSAAATRWLQELDASWELFTMADDTWEVCQARILDALTAVMAPYRTTAIVTKLLHIKRPKLIPVCDSYVCAMIGRRARTAADATKLIGDVREVGRVNIDALVEISARLTSIGIDRTLVRILDALLWSCYQTAGPYAEFGPWLTRWHAGRLFFTSAPSEHTVPR